MKAALWSDYLAGMGNKDYLRVVLLEKKKQIRSLARIRCRDKGKVL